MAALRAVGVELDGRKAQAIREPLAVGKGRGKGRGKEAAGDQPWMQIEEELGILAFESEAARGSFVSGWERRYEQQCYKRYKQAADGRSAAIAAAGKDEVAQGCQAGQGQEAEEEWGAHASVSVVASGEGGANEGSIEEGGRAELDVRESFRERLEELKEYKRRHGAILRAVLCCRSRCGGRAVCHAAALSDSLPRLAVWMRCFLLLTRHYTAASWVRTLACAQATHALHVVMRCWDYG